MLIFLLFGCQENPNKEKMVISDLWNQTNSTIKSMHREDRLYKINKDKIALVIVDMQNGFCSTNGCLEIPDSRKIISNINELVTLCRKNGIPIIWLRMNISSNREANNGLWPNYQPRSPVSVDRTDPPEALKDLKFETEIYPELNIDTLKDFQIPKNRYSAFISGSSELDSLLKKMKKDQLIMTGVGTNVCVESTARDAMMLNYEVIVISDATATVNKLLHEVSLMNIKMFFGDVISTQEAINDLSSLN